jgi:hypothetical protein
MLQIIQYSIIHPLGPITTNNSFESVLEPLDRLRLIDTMRCTYLGLASSAFRHALAWSGPTSLSTSEAFVFQDIVI